MEGSMDMISSTTSSTAPASALHHKQEAAMVASSTREDGNVKAKQARLQQAAPSGGGERKPRPQLDEALKCPRCDSTDTKFCYYNNNSMTQPRYFCKACRRHWTQGGTLRNVPVGGSIRKNKQNRTSGSGSSSASSASSSSTNSKINSTQLMMMMPTAMTTAATDFPNMFPTFMSTGGGIELPTSMDMDHQVSLPFAPLSLCGSGAPPSFLNMLSGGFLDGSSSCGSNGMAPSFGAMPMHGHGMGGSTDQHATQLMGPPHGVEEVKPMAAGGGLQRLSPQHGSLNDDGFTAAGSAGGVVQQQEEEEEEEEEEEVARW